MHTPTARDKHFVKLLAAGNTVADSYRGAGLSKPTAYRRFADPRLDKLYEELHTEVENGVARELILDKMMIIRMANEQLIQLLMSSNEYVVASMVKHVHATFGSDPAIEDQLLQPKSKEAVMAKYCDIGLVNTYLVLAKEVSDEAVTLHQELQVMWEKAKTVAEEAADTPIPRDFLPDSPSPEYRFETWVKEQVRERVPELHFTEHKLIRLLRGGYDTSR
jgi:hypothetical protein